jgi:tRNA (guanine6-N2)-methyltransferase
VRYLLIGDPGLEDVVVDEVRGRWPELDARPRPYGIPGLATVAADDAGNLRSLTTIHHIVEVRGEATVDSLDDIRRAVADVELPQLVGAESFRVSTRLEGEHGFVRREVEGAAGAVILNAYGTRVDLEGYAVNVRVDLYGSRLVTGVQMTGKDLGNRIRRARVLRTSLKPTIAAAMIRMAGAHRGEGSLIDPLCGTGTIPIEAKRANPALVVYASDWDDRTVEAARGTIANHGADIDLRVADARSLGSVYSDPFDYIVSDPPYGVRLGKRVSMRGLYADLLQSFEASLAEGGRIALVVLKFRAFLRALAPIPLRIVDERLIEASGLHPRIFVLERSV